MGCCCLISLSQRCDRNPQKGQTRTQTLLEAFLTTVHPQLMGVHSTRERKDGNNSNVHWWMVQMFFRGTRWNSTMWHATRDLPQNSWATKDGRSHWVTPMLDETQHYNVLCETYHKPFKQRWKVVHTGVGQPPHSIKLNTVMCYVRLTAKHSSNDGRLSTPRLGNSHTQWNSTLWRTTHDLPQNIRAMKEGRLHWVWVTPTFDEIQHYNVLCETYRKTLERRRKVVHIGVG